MSAPSPNPHSAPHSAARDTTPASGPDASAPAHAGTALEGGAHAASPEDEARTPAEYTEPPGSHRRPSDGAALDVGG